MKKLLNLILGLAVLATLGGLAPVEAGDKASPTPTPQKPATTVKSSKSNASERAPSDKVTPAPLKRGNTIKLATGCWVPDGPSSRTAHWVDPCPGGTMRSAASTTPRPRPLARGSGDPLKGLNVSKHKGCWVADGPGSKTAHWVDHCP